MGKLVLFLADGTTLDIPLDRDRVTVGRRAGNDVCLPYPAVSGSHAVFVVGPAGVVVEDLGSTNGTAVNGQRTAKHMLQDGDRIDIGRQTLVYLADADAVAPQVNPGEAGLDRGGDGAGGGGLESASALSDVNSADPQSGESPSLASADAFTPVLPVATAETWLSPPGPTGSTGAGNPAARSTDDCTLATDATDDAPMASAASAAASAGPIVRVLTGPERRPNAGVGEG